MASGNGTFMMDPAAVQQSGTNFQNFSIRYSTEMNNLRNVIEDLGRCWKSEDYNQFLQIYQQNAEVIQQMSKAFASFGEVLTTTGTNAVQKSEDLRASFK